MAAVADPVREKALQDYRKKLLEHKEVESRLKESKSSIFVGELFSHFLFFCSSRSSEGADQAIRQIRE